ncbi:MAG: acyltransferase [Bacteroidales bacterium]|nr:acyltransferase [Bacteroidales bacterium]
MEPYFRADRIFTELTPDALNDLALQLFRFQFDKLKIYGDYCHHLGINPKHVVRVEQIPFIPISFFTSHKIITDGLDELLVFMSSGTTGMTRSLHYVHNPDWYIKSFTKGFNHFYGSPDQYCLLGLLPSYLEQGNSSLVYMVDQLMRQGGHPQNGFFLYDFDTLQSVLKQCQANAQKTMLIGVSYALLDFVEKHPLRFNDLIVVETGGMKGRRKEMVREELHSLLSGGFGVDNIHSEYGMTELLSQAYSAGEGKFRTPPWMKILIRDMNDPRGYMENGRIGGINVIDLANVYSCAFIATQDIGKMNNDGSFEVLGRFDNSDIRGCNLMIE